MAEQGEAVAAEPPWNAVKAAVEEEAVVEVELLLAVLLPLLGGRVEVAAGMRRLGHGRAITQRRDETRRSPWM